MTWVGILAGSLACYVLKLAGLMVPSHMLDTGPARRIAYMLPVVLLGALITTQTLADDDALTIDARLAGVVVATALVYVRAPFLVVVFGAAGMAALLRAL
jgi:branched-subunit amino acid transport protein